MLHEILLSIWGYPTSLGHIVETDTVLLDKYFHPGERVLMRKIVKIANDCNNIKNFIKEYSTIRADLEDNNEMTLPRGLYLQGLCDGMDEALEPFKAEIIDMERTVLRDTHIPVTLILSRIENYQFLFKILNDITRQIKTQKLHGCALLQCLHQYMNTGIPQVKIAIRKMLHGVHAVFYKQLTSWLLYGHLEDIHNEFFIQRIPSSQKVILVHGNRDNSGYNKKNNDMWEYDIVLSMLPPYIRMSLATKILAIGQTIIIFGNDPRQEKVCSMIEKPENAIWGHNEHEYFIKLQSLQIKTIFNVTEFENIIDELKQCVTKLLWQVAVDDSQLLQQLKLIKDFYLLGRGDLFLDFITFTSHILNKTPTNHTSRDINLAFQLTMRRVMLIDESATDSFNFILSIPDDQVSSDSNPRLVGVTRKERDDPIDKQGWGMILLQYRVIWPLQLLFNPKTLNDYNTIFCFLLRVKKTQINLWSLWMEHMRAKNIDIGVLQLRNNLVFILDNLQYYLQVDVLECQYTLMENRMKSTKNFEEIQIAHSIFLANILSQTFLSTNFERQKNPVINLIRLLLRLCDDFILQASMWEVTNLLSTEKQELNTLIDTLNSVMDLLIKTLNRVRAQPSGKHLAQLLLRLDFNRWFSKQTE